jgi:hypothetical protein
LLFFVSVFREPEVSEIERKSVCLVTEPAEGYS